MSPEPMTVTEMRVAERVIHEATAGRHLRKLDALAESAAEREAALEDAAFDAAAKALRKMGG